MNSSYDEEERFHGTHPQTGVCEDTAQPRDCRNCRGRTRRILRRGPGRSASLRSHRRLDRCGTAPTLWRCGATFPGTDRPLRRDRLLRDQRPAHDRRSRDQRACILLARDRSIRCGRPAPWGRCGSEYFLGAPRAGRHRRGLDPAHRGAALFDALAHQREHETVDRPRHRLLRRSSSAISAETAEIQSRAAAQQPVTSRGFRFAGATDGADHDRRTGAPVVVRGQPPVILGEASKASPRRRSGQVPSKDRLRSS